jgi:hypothetical protein
MRARTFRVPFSQVAPEATELEWGPDDYIVVRPLLTRSASDAFAISARLAETETMTGKKGEEARRAFIVSIIDELIVEWSLTDGEGRTVPKPTTAEAFLALPSGLAASLFGFLMGYRGDEAANPTTAA